MCGIAGVMFLDGAAPAHARGVVEGMRNALAHRGPDGSGVWCASRPGGPTVAFAHTRLAILDLSDIGRQPMTDDGRTAITYNGETYNYRTLRAVLADSGVAFRSQTDTEVVLQAWRRWGTDALTRLDGMFAFAIWDDAQSRLVLARDRMGIKPLYYSVQDRVVVFASEVRALLASDEVPRRVNDASVWHYLGYQTAPTPDTLVESVRLLEPGCVLTVDAHGALDHRRYWDLMATADLSAADANLEIARIQVRDRLQDAVASHLVSDVPVGVFLSGGIDSSALVATLGAQGIHPQTFNVGFDEADFDESVYAADVARAYHCDHREIRLSESDLLEQLPHVAAAVDHPSGDGVNTYVVSKAVREAGVKVALSGLGGDELFGGYPSFERLPRLLPAARHWGRSPRAVRKTAAGVVRIVGGGSVTATKAAALLESDGDLARLWPVTRQLFSVEERQSLMPSALWPTSEARNPYEATLDAAFNAHPDRQVWSRVSYAEARLYMHDVLLRDADQMSMAHGLEIRVPLLDHRLVEYVMGLRDRVKQHGTTPKSLLVDSVPIPLPRSVTDRPKRGFTLPFDRWMRGALGPFCAVRLGSNGLEGRGLLRPGAGTRLWRAFLDRAPGVTWARVWALVALETWLERHQIEGRAA